jgi:thioester reductase-like protein
MKIIITGASGFVGRLLVDELSSSEHKLLLIGRNKNLLTATFPGLTVGDYGDLTRLGKDFDILVHLAVANNETNHPEKVFFETNVEFLLKTSRTAAQLNIKRFINISTVHALDEDNSTPYARSKRDAAVLLKKENSSSETIYLPLVYGNQWNGKLRFLNRLPRTIANNIFIPIAALKPTLHISELARYIISPTNSVTDDLNILCNDQELNAFYSYTKRGIDLCFAFSVFLLLGWLLALIWILVRLDSPGPGFFVQSRLGRYGNRIFSVFKFRTMLQDTKNQGTHETSINAVTRIGRFL